MVLSPNLFFFIEQKKARNIINKLLHLPPLLSIKLTFGEILNIVTNIFGNYIHNATKLSVDVVWFMFSIFYSLSVNRRFNETFITQILSFA